MDFDPLFPGMANTVGALLPALISFGIVVARRARSWLGMGDQLWLGVFSLVMSLVLARVTITSEEISLHIVPGATVFVCYLAWRGYYISPGLAFALTYASCLPVDFFLAQLVIGAEFNPECVGGGGWRDGLLIFPHTHCPGGHVCQLAHGQGGTCRIILVRTADRRSCACTGNRTIWAELWFQTTNSLKFIIMNVHKQAKDGR